MSCRTRNALTRIAEYGGYEVWIAPFDRSAGVYECFASEDGDDYLGAFDNKSEAYTWAWHNVRERCEG